MNKKIYIILFSIFIVLNLVISEETNDLIIPKKTKAIELSIGGGFNHSYLFSGLYVRSSEISNYFYTRSSSITLDYYGTQGFMVMIPFSAVYYFNKYFGFGITNSLGFNIIITDCMYPGYFEITNSTRIINKIGNLEKKNFFVFEYGLALYGGLTFGHYYSNSDSAIKTYKYDSLITNFMLGPTIFIGFDRITNNNFDFSIGGAIDTSISYRNNKYTYDDNQLYEMLGYTMHFGLELRLRFSFLKVL